MNIYFIFSIDPIGKARPRFSKYGTYTPKKTKSFEDHVKISAVSQMKEMRAKPIEGAIAAHIKFIIKRKKSVKRKYATVKPDLDNMIKAIMDALNGVAYKDDCQVVQLMAEKVYTETSDSGRITVELRGLETQPQSV